MATADEHLRTDMGQILTAMLFQIATLKAELDVLREREKTRDGVPPEHHVSR
jgi:hypothetical protein